MQPTVCVTVDEDNSIAVFPAVCGTFPFEWLETASVYVNQACAHLSGMCVLGWLITTVQLVYAWVPQVSVRTYTALTYMMVDA